MKEQLDKEMREYNELMGNIANLREQVRQMDENRLQRLGRIQLLSELISKSASTNGHEEPETPKPEPELVGAEE